MHGVDVEGKQLGIDEELVALLGASSPLPVTYAGGVRSLVRPDAEHVCARQADLGGDGGQSAGTYNRGGTCPSVNLMLRHSSFRTRHFQSMSQLVSIVRGLGVLQ